MAGALGSLPSTLSICGVSGVALIARAPMELSPGMAAGFSMRPHREAKDPFACFDAQLAHSHAIAHDTAILPSHPIANKGNMEPSGDYYLP